jgi:hypothetical protein
MDRTLRPLLFIALLAGLVAAPASAQVFIRMQGLLEGVRQPEQMGTVREVVSAMPLVGMVRVCPTTHTLMIQAKPGHQVNASALNDLLAPKGFRVRCFRELGAEEAFAPIVPSTCLEDTRPEHDR